MSSDSELSFGWVPAEDEICTFDEENITKTSQEIDYCDIEIKPEPLDENVNKVAKKRNVEVTSSKDRYQNSLNNSIKDNNILEYSKNKSNKTILDNRNSTELSSMFELFFKSNPKLSSVSSTTMDDINNDSEVWTVQYPANINLTSLVGFPILSNEKKKIKISNTKYECVPVEKCSSENICLLMPPLESEKSRIKMLRVNGKFVIREQLENVRYNQTEEDIVSKVPFPENLKIRHPLFGIDYKSSIKISRALKKKLESSNNTYDDEEQTMEESQSPINVFSLESEGSRRAKRKRKASTTEEVGSIVKKIKKEIIE